MDRLDDAADTPSIWCGWSETKSKYASYAFWIHSHYVGVYNGVRLPNADLADLTKVRSSIPTAQYELGLSHI